MPSTTTNLLLRKPLGTDAPDGAGQVAALADDIDSALNLRNNGSVVQRYIGGAWRNWESWWIDCSTTTTFPSSGLTFTITTARYRWSGGRVHFLFSGTIHVVGSGFVQISLPVARDSAGGLAYSNAFAVHAGQRYAFLADFASTGTANLYFTAGTNGIANAMAGGSPVGWSDGDPFALEMTYDA